MNETSGWHKFRKYVPKKDISIDARKLEEEEYFQNRLMKKGDYIVSIGGVEYSFSHELFEILFCRKYTNLQEFIDENQDNPAVIEVTEAFLSERFGG